MTNLKFDDDEYSLDEIKFSRNNLKHDNELFNDKDNIIHDSINVKLITLSKGGEDWEIFKNKKNVLTLKGIRFTKKEKNFLRTPLGMSFIINGYKKGWKSVSEFKRQVKKCQIKTK